MSHRSFSAVNNLRKCGEQYRLERVEKVVPQPMAAGVAGSVIHEISEFIDLEINAGTTDEGTLTLMAQALVTPTLDREVEDRTSEEYPDPKTWKSIGRRTKEKPYGEDIAWFRQVGIPNALSNYIKWRLEHPELVLYSLPDGALAVEVPFEVHVSDGEPIRGKIDRVFINANNGIPIVVDLKSGVKPKSSEQLGVYRKALMAGTGLDFHWGAFVYQMKKVDEKGNSLLRVTPDIDLSIWTDEALSRIYGTADALINQQLFIPNPGEACFMCCVQKNCKFYQGSIL